ncbi:MAG: YHS domain-containing protein [Fimbriimonadaceae bacterium]
MFRTITSTMMSIALLALIGCATTPEPAASGDVSDTVQNTEKAAAGAEMEAAVWPTDVEINKDAEGNVVCAVMNSKIESPDKAVGYQDYEGKRYYFCCDGCPESFKKDPAKYAQK